MQVLRTPCGNSTINMGEPKPIREQGEKQADFDKRMDEWMQLQQPQAPSNEVKPQEFELEGVITGVTREISKEGKAFRFITVGTEQLLVPKVMFDNNKALLVEGNSIVVKGETSIAGKTGYVDQNTKKWTLHTGSGKRFISAVLTIAGASRKGALSEKVTETSALTSAKQMAKVEAINSLTDKLLANLDSEEAKATVMAGAYSALAG